MQAPSLNHIPSSATTPPSLAPCIPSTVAMNNLNTPQGYKSFFKVSSLKNSKRASISSKIFKNLSGLKDFRASFFKVSGGLRDCTLHNGHLVLEGLKFSRVLKDFKLFKG